MKKVLISVLVSSLLLGTMIAKPKAKVETPVPEPVPEMKFQEWFEKARTVTGPEVFKGLVSDCCLYDLGRNVSIKNGVVYNPTLDDIINGSNGYFTVKYPNFHHLWFVGMDTKEAWDKSTWGTFEVEVTPYKKDVRGCPTKDDFITDYLERHSNENVYVINTNLQKNINPDFVKALPALEDKGSSSQYDFAWVFSDEYFVFQAGSYKESAGWRMKPKTKTSYPEGQPSNLFFFYDYDTFMSFNLLPAYRRLFEEREVYTPQDFFDVLEARLKKEGTKEQLDNFYLIKDYLVAQYSAE